MKIDKMPITVVLLTISWSLLVLSVLVPVYLIISAGISPNILIISLLVFIGGIILTALIRMFANIGQIIFDIRREIQRVREINSNCAQNLSGVNQNILGLGQGFKNELHNQTMEIDKIIKALDRSLTESQAQKSQAVKSELQNQASELNKSILRLSGELVSELKSLSANLQILASSSEQINCDSKDLNQNISQIKTFFEQIERHLDLKQ